MLKLDLAIPFGEHPNHARARALENAKVERTGELEMAVLSRTNGRRAFSRIEDADLERLLQTA